jgi:hypothetical protein
MKGICFSKMNISFVQKLMIFEFHGFVGFLMDILTAKHQPQLCEKLLTVMIVFKKVTSCNPVKHFQHVNLVFPCYTKPLLYVQQNKRETDN